MCGASGCLLTPSLASPVYPFCCPEAIRNLFVVSTARAQRTKSQLAFALTLLCIWTAFRLTKALVMVSTSIRKQLDHGFGRRFYPLRKPPRG